MDDFVQTCIDRCVEDAVDQFAEELRDLVGYAKDVPPFESLLEEAFWYCWQVVDRASGLDAKRTSLRAQVAVDGLYRIDFQVVSEVKGFPRLAIELDGHEFHEKTKEQVARRNERDRHLVGRGWKVFHVSGSEFYRDPHGVTSELWEEAYEAWRLIASEELVRRG